MNAPKIRALIVDDEPPARELIATLLQREPDVELAGQCANGKEAIAAIENLSPHVVFLDVQMPGLNGLDVIAQARPKLWPQVIFVTAFDKYAVAAFQARAIDYVLKPFEYDRIRESMERARQRLRDGEAAACQARLLELLEDLQKPSQNWDRIAVKEIGRMIFIRPEEIDWIEAEGNYLRLRVGKKSHLLRETMASAEARLASKKFLRVSRSTLVNLERVKEWQPLFHGDSALILENGARLTISRLYRENFDRVVSQLGP
jgi:two-component system LytT family response regulator